MRKTQSALEYLLSYGWALLILTIIGIFLFSLGVFNPAQNTATIVKGISYFNVNDALLDSDGDLFLKLGLKTGKTTQINNIDYDVEGYSCFNSVDEDDFTLSPDKTILVSLSSDSSCELTKNTMIKMNISINYNKISGLEHVDKGRIRILVEPSVNITGAGNFTWTTNSESGFNEGTYTNTTWGSVMLETGYFSGSYTSKVFDAENNASWNNINWENEYYKQEYSPDTNTILLMHLNKSIGELPLGFKNSVLLNHFNEDSGNIIDYSGHNNDGVVSDGIYANNGVFNESFGFDGTDDYITVTNDDSINPEEKITVSVWIKPESITNFGNKVIVSKNGFGYKGWDLYHEYYHNGSSWAPRLRVRIDDNTTSSIIELSEGIWQHVGFTYNSTHIKLFYNGRLIQTFINDSFTLNSSNNLRIGGFSGGGNHYKGLIDELVIFNHSLSEDEFLKLYDRNNSLVKDSSSYDNNGFTENGASSINGFFNNGMFFDGIDDYINISDDDSLDLTASGTLGAWINMDKHESYAGIIHKGDLASFSDEAYGLQFWQDNGRIRVFISNTSWVYNYVDSLSLLNTNEWYFIVGTWNSSRISVYINGQLDNSVSNSYSARKTDGDLLIGCQVNSQYCPNGTIDEAFVLNHDLSSEEILDIYNKGILRLNSSFRSCDDENCDTETWSEQYSQDVTNLGVDKNQFFQYKFNFYTSDNSYSPKLYNVSVGYELT